MSFMGKTLSQLEAPFSTANSTARLVFAGSDLFTSSCFSFRQSSFSLRATMFVMFLFLLSPGEFDVETLSAGGGVLLLLTDASYSNVAT